LGVEESILVSCRALGIPHAWLGWRGVGTSVTLEIGLWNGISPLRPPPERVLSPGLSPHCPGRGLAWQSGANTRTAASATAEPRSGPA